ncbi:MAG: glycoside hydrolase family 97 N-terminal domain-containing protein, partial [Bacteroidaceae bacterium]|nr:glycoside hydrolase family 97 N-terminal domain-containing protein [Bacteroidaceae bacterium]
MKKIITALLILCVSAGAGAQTSPNGKIKAIAKGDSIKISYRDGGKWQQICSAEVKGISGLTRKSNVNEKYQMLLGKRQMCQAKGVEYQYSLASGGSLILRVYNDGVAFRLMSRVSMDFNGEQPVAVSFASATNNWLQKWVDSYEEFFPKNRPTKKGDRWAFPSLFEYGNGVFALLTEADVHKDNAASCLYSTDKKGEFTIVADENVNIPKMSTWKTVIIG